MISVLSALLTVAAGTYLILLTVRCLRPGSFDASFVSSAGRTAGIWLLGSAAFSLVCAPDIKKTPLPPNRAGVSSRRTRAYRALTLILAAALIALGVQNGGLRDVLIKAVNICSECIGLG